MRLKTLNSLIFLFLMISANAQWQHAGNYTGRIEDESVFIKDNTIFIGTHADGVFKSTDHGANWTASDNGLPGAVNSFTSVGSTIFAGLCCGHGVYKSTNNGLNWTASNSGLPIENTDELVTNGTTIFSLTSLEGIYKSSNNGLSWTAANNGLPLINTFYQLSSIAVCGSNIFAGTYHDGIYKSSNNGVSWATVNNGLPSNIVINDIEGTASSIYAAVGNEIYLSNNSGLNWTKIYTGKCDSSVISEIAIKNSNIFAVSHITYDINGLIYYLDTIFLSKNNGLNWTVINDGLPVASMNICALTMDSSTIFAGTYCSNFNGKGIYKRELSEVLEITESFNSCKINIYPTPANDKIFIETQSYKDAIAEIFNIEGRLLQSIKLYVSQTEINVADLPRGLYIVKIKREEEIINKKFIKL